MSSASVSASMALFIGHTVLRYTLRAWVLVIGGPALSADATVGIATNSDPTAKATPHLIQGFI
jgi:hypothetical protein